VGATVFVCGVWGGVPGKVLMDVTCAEMCLKLNHFGMSLHVIVTVIDPLSYLACWLGHNLFWVNNMGILAGRLV